MMQWLFMDCAQIPIGAQWWGELGVQGIQGWQWGCKRFYWMWHIQLLVFYCKQQCWLLDYKSASIASKNI